MTAIMLGAVLVGRQSLSMRNLAVAAALVIAIEPDALLGASFQLSFAAVAALVAVFEARAAFGAQRREANFGRAPAAMASAWKERLALIRERLAHGPAALIFAIFCATTATASFMANDFHELSPYGQGLGDDDGARRRRRSPLVARAEAALGDEPGAKGGCRWRGQRSFGAAGVRREPRVNPLYVGEVPSDFDPGADEG